MTDRVDLAGDHLNAARFLDAYKDKLRWSPELNRWFAWNDAWWEQDALEQVQDAARVTIDQLRPWVTEGKGDELKKRAAHYVSSTKGHRIEGMLQIARTQADVVVAIEDLDQYPLLLACRNGTVDLTTGALQDADRSQLLTHGVKLDYDPAARSERFESFLNTTFGGNADLIEYVQRILGYACTGVVRDHVVPIFWGHGRNGRSTLVGAFQDILGGLARVAPEGLFVLSNNNPHPERIAELKGRRLVPCFELENRVVLAEGLVKTMTGGDILTGRFLHRDRIEFKPTHKVILITNHKPRIHGTDTSIWDRVKLVPFEHTMPAAEQDGDLRRRLVEEDGSALLTWAVQGAVKWANQGLGICKAVSNATETYRAEQDTFVAFMDENTGFATKGDTKVIDLWRRWKAWCDQAGEKPGRQQDLVVAVQDHGYAVFTHQNARFIKHLLLVTPQDPSNEISHGERDIGKESFRGNEGSPDTWPDGTPHGLLSSGRRDS